MSYILDALKRAEQERGVSPRAVPPPREMPEGSLARARGPWIAGGLVGAAALLAPPHSHARAPRRPPRGPSRAGLRRPDVGRPAAWDRRRQRPTTTPGARPSHRGRRVPRGAPGRARLRARPSTPPARPLPARVFPGRPPAPAT